MAKASGFTHGPENGGIRDVNADIEAALKTRIAEYKVHGRDTAYLEERLQAMVNAKKGRRKSSEEVLQDESAGRADNDDCAVGEQEAERVKREGGKTKTSKKPEGVPDQLPDGSLADPQVAAGPSDDVPDQTSPWPAKKVEPAIKQPADHKSGEGFGSSDPEKPKAEAKKEEQKPAPAKSAQASKK